MELLSQNCSLRNIYQEYCHKIVKKLLGIAYKIGINVQTRLVQT